MGNELLMVDAWVFDTTLPAHNIPGIFAECSLSVAIFRASREHLGRILMQNIFLINSHWKSCF